MNARVANGAQVNIDLSLRYEQRTTFVPLPSRFRRCLLFFCVYRFSPLLSSYALLFLSHCQLSPPFPFHRNPRWTVLSFASLRLASPRLASPRLAALRFGSDESRKTGLFRRFTCRFDQGTRASDSFETNSGERRIERAPPPPASFLFFLFPRTRRQELRKFVTSTVLLPRWISPIDREPPLLWTGDKNNSGTLDSVRKFEDSRRLPSPHSRSRLLFDIPIRSQSFKSSPLTMQIHRLDDLSRDRGRFVKRFEVTPGLRHCESDSGNELAIKRPRIQRR